MMGLFGKGKDPKELVREWQAGLRKEGRVLERQVQSIEREQQKVKISIKQAAKKNDMVTCRVLAKSIVESNKAVNRLNAAKAQLKSVEYHMNEQLATLRLSGALQKSTEVMVNMGKLVHVSDVSASMREMSKEMMKAGIIEEMISESMDDAIMNEEEDDEDVQAEVDKVLNELVAGPIGKLPDAVKDSLPVLPPSKVPQKSSATRSKESQMVTEDDDEDDVSGMQARLAALRS